MKASTLFSLLANKEIAFGVFGHMQNTPFMPKLPRAIVTLTLTQTQHHSLKRLKKNDFNLCGHTGHPSIPNDCQQQLVH